MRFANAVWVSYVSTCLPNLVCNLFFVSFGFRLGVRLRRGRSSPQLCRTDAQAAVIARSLGPSVVKLSLDPNGNHVVQRALQHMPAPRNNFVLEAITASLVQVPTP